MILIFIVDGVVSAFCGCGNHSHDYKDEKVAKFLRNAPARVRRHISKPKNRQKKISFYEDESAKVSFVGGDVLSLRKGIHFLVLRRSRDTGNLPSHHVKQRLKKHKRETIRHIAFA